MTDPPLAPTPEDLNPPSPALGVSHRAGLRTQLSAQLRTHRGTKPDLGTLLERVATGDEVAVRDCVSQYGDLVWSLALRLLRRRSEAEDAVQEIFVDVWRSAARYDPGIASEATFITTIARRRLYDRLRRAGRRPETVSDEVLNHAPSAVVMAADTMERNSEAYRAARALDALPAAEREVLMLAMLEGHSHSEIAEHLEMPLGTVKTRARRGLLRLREQLSTEVASTADRKRRGTQ